MLSVSSPQLESLSVLSAAINTEETTASRQFIQANFMTKFMPIQRFQIPHEILKSLISVDLIFPPFGKKKIKINVIYMLNPEGKGWHHCLGDVLGD